MLGFITSNATALSTGPVQQTRCQILNVGSIGGGEEGAQSLVDVHPGEGLNGNYFTSPFSNFCLSGCTMVQIISIIFITFVLVKV